MKLRALETIRSLVFSTSQVAQALRITPPSARLSCHRYVKRGDILRLKRDVYILKSAWNQSDFRKRCEIANRLQVPSYVSFLSALAYYELTTQIPQSGIESAAMLRTKTYAAEGFEFCYLKLKPSLYFGFVKKDNFFIASPEKAFLDAIYLSWMGRYYLDRSALEAAKLNKKRTMALAKRFPRKVRNEAEALWKK